MRRRNKHVGAKSGKEGDLSTVDSSLRELANCTRYLHVKSILKIHEILFVAHNDIFYFTTP